jgi:peptidoglycan/xylan/chitin deacetylase (PgdA/CDA1 family)
MSSIVISLDFEMFWGVADSKTIENYGKNIEGVWRAVPAMLTLFKKYDIHVTWATVGMLMCKDYEQWRELRPPILPKYERESLSPYSFASLARDFPELFFARSLIEQILAVNGQEIGSHTYSHFYGGEEGATIESFISDMNSNQVIFSELGITPTSFVFPRNQVREDYLKILSDFGFTGYRGNQEHWLYRKGSSVPHSSLARYMRFADDYIPISGNHVLMSRSKGNDMGLINVAASRFLRPSTSFSVFDQLNVWRIKRGMLEAAKTGGTFHLWWHPHNFGLRTEINLKNLECILKYYRYLNQKYGMCSLSMSDFSHLMTK